MKSKRLFTFVMAVVMMFSVCTTLPMKISVPLEASATQIRKDNFNKNYSLTGNGPTDMLSIAFAQIGRTGNDFGYTESWCANFVSDCAELAGQSAAIPRTGSVSHEYTQSEKWYGIKQTILNAGGYTVSSPQPGDIVIWKNSISHVEIVSKVENGVVYSIGGNNGRTGNPKTNSVKGERKCSSIGTVTCYIRPNYYVPDPNPPTNVTLSKNQIWYDIKDTIILNANSDNTDTYWISVLKNGESVINTQISGKLSFSASDYGYGDYEAWVSAVNSAGSTDSNHIDFPIVGAATYTGINTSKNVYFTDETVTISVDTVCAKGQVIGIDNIDTGRVITEECDSTYTISANQLGVGEYSAYFSVYNGSGSIDTERVSFTICDKSSKYDTVPEKPEPYVEKKSYSINETVTITWNKTQATDSYWLHIYRNGEEYINQSVNKELSFSAMYPSGNYTAYIASCNGIGETVSSIDFFVYNTPPEPPKPYMEKKSYSINETATITWDEIANTDSYWLHIYRNGEEYINQSVNKELSFSAMYPSGNYTAYIASCNGIGETVSEVEFSVFEIGDANGDGTVNVSDAVVLQKWLLGSGTLTNWESVDLCKDGRIDVFDMIEMRKLIVKK